MLVYDADWLTPTLVDLFARVMRPSRRIGPLTTISWVSAGLTAALATLFYFLAQGLRSYLPDEGIYGFVGWSWLHGDWPYRDAWDHKGPLVYATAAARIAVLGTTPEMLAVQEIALGLLTATAIAVIAWRLWGAAAAAAGFAAGVLIWAQRSPDFGHMSTPGSIIGLANSAGVLAAVLACQATRPRSQRMFLLLVGAFGGLAFCAKPNAPTCILLALFLVTLYFRHLVFEAVGVMVLGFLVPVLLFVLLFAAASALPDLIDTVVAYNLARGGGLLGQLGLPALAQTIIRQLQGGGVLILVTTILVVSGIALLTRTLGGRTVWVKQPVEWVVPAWVSLELLVFASNGAFTHHLYGVLPALALAVPWLIVGTSSSMRAPRCSALTALLTLLYGPMIMSTVSNIRGVDRSQQVPVWRQMADWIAANSEPAERIMVFTGWGEPAMLTLAERRSATRYFHPTALWAAGNLHTDPWAEIVELLDSPKPPRILVLNVWGLSAPGDGIETLEWALGRLDHPLVHPLIRGEDRIDSIPWVKQLITEGYQLRFCEGNLCVAQSRISTPLSFPVPD